MRFREVSSTAVFVSAVGLFVLSACASAPPEPARRLTATDSGRLSFTVRQGFSTVTLDGNLLLPDGQGPFPAVVLLHGCAGVTSTVGGWVDALLGWNYATFVVDSLTGRGFREVCTQYLALPSEARVPDGYSALHLLATHPRIDPARTALMGFSHGAATTIMAAEAFAARRHTRSDGPRFRAFFAFYPRCLNALQGRRTAGPLRIHTAELDDWTPARECVELAAMLKRGGNDVETTVYPGAYHAFDAVGAPAYRRLANVQNWATGRLQYGATVGYSREATEAAREKVRAELTGLVETARPLERGPFHD